MYFQQWPLPGTIVYVYFLGVLIHKGIVSDRLWNGKPMVIANSAKTNGVAEIPWDDFTEGRNCYAEPYTSALSRERVIFNARRLMGAQYRIGTFNCEVFVNVCQGKPAHSTQVVAGLCFAMVGVALLAAAQANG